jgi:hypothetical protein
MPPASRLFGPFAGLVIGAAACSPIPPQVPPSLTSDGAEVEATAAAAPTGPAPTPMPEPTVLPASTPLPRTIFVGNTDGMGAYVRQRPAMADKIKAYPDGTALTIIGPGTQAEGQSWLRVRAPDGVDGWVPQQYTIDTPIARQAPSTAVSARAAPTAAREFSEAPPHLLALALLDERPGRLNCRLAGLAGREGCQTFPVPRWDPRDVHCQWTETVDGFSSHCVQGGIAPYLRVQCRWLPSKPSGNGGKEWETQCVQGSVTYGNSGFHCNVFTGGGRATWTCRGFPAGIWTGVASL